MARGASAALAAIALLALAGPVSAATTITQRIYRDLADNGRLDGHYTRAQINRALHAPSLQGYEQPATAARRPAMVPAPSPGPADARGPLPFSGLDLALFGGVGGPLLLLGASLGRLVRPRSDQELSS